MQKQHVLKYYQDASHGWVAIKKKTLASLGVLNKLSRYSYHRGGTVYVEHDCDLDVVLGAMQARGDAWRLIDVDHGMRSWIRSLEYFQKPLKPHVARCHDGRYIVTFANKTIDCTSYDAAIMAANNFWQSQL